MEKISVIGITILIFLIITFIYWKLTRGYAKKESGKKLWLHWGPRPFSWTGALMISGGLTVLIIFLLNSANILTF